VTDLVTGLVLLIAAGVVWALSRRRSRAVAPPPPVLPVEPVEVIEASERAASVVVDLSVPVEVTRDDVEELVDGDGDDPDPDVLRTLSGE
tara:strand:+ start:340 stop:609 length:270 start_codon:yes stop_codon:yes gene_type:complete